MDWFKHYAAKPMPGQDDALNVGDEEPVEPDLQQQPLSADQQKQELLNMYRSVGLPTSGANILNNIMKNPQDVKNMHQLEEIKQQHMNMLLKQPSYEQQHPLGITSQPPKSSGPGPMKPPPKTHPANDPRKKPSPAYDKSQQMQKKKRHASAWLVETCKFSRS